MAQKLDTQQYHSQLTFIMNSHSQEKNHFNQEYFESVTIHVVDAKNQPH
jgi:hypothetical protein